MTSDPPRLEEGMATKKDDSGTWPVALTLITMIVCSTAIALALILS